MPQRIKIEFLVPDEVDPSTILEMAQELAVELNEMDDDDLSENDIEVIKDDVTVTTASGWGRAD